MAYQWFSVKGDDGAKASTLFLEDVTMEISGNYHVEITNEYGSVTSEVTRLTVVNTMQEALDNGNYAFDSGPEDTWVLDNQIHTDGEDSARSPAIEDNESTWVEMEVEGPGTVFFSWRTTNDYGQEFDCFLDDKAVARFKKGYSWEQPRWLTGSVRLDEGEHVIRWEYSKQRTFGRNLYAWLDNVRFLTEEEIKQEALVALGLEEDVPFEFGGDGSWMVDKNKALDEEGGLTISEIPQGGEGWIEATLSGPGYLDFHYKTLGFASEVRPLQLHLDGELQEGSELVFNTEQLGWNRIVLEIPEGEHKVRWAVSDEFGNIEGIMLDWVEFTTVERSEPEIELQPKSQETTAPGWALFEVEAWGYPFPTYQWYLNDEPIDGATGRVLTMGSLWADDEGVIKVVVSNELGEVESDEVDLTVLETLDESLADAIDFEDGKVISISFHEEMQTWKRFTSKSTDGEDSAGHIPLGGLVY